MSTTSARTPDPVRSLIEPPQGTALAVSYLRVSTKEQAEKGGTDEGFSIPAQREANRRKAEQLGAVIVKEFIDAGESARKADRPELMRMIQYVKRNRVAYCIVHKVDRLARNRADDVTIHLALQEAGVMLVSATENIDETPSGMLLHGIMSTIAEFYSRNLATEVIKGMTQKAATGGTVGKAPIGYLNIRSRDELGREVRTVQLDPDRAPLIEWAYKAYASGNWTVSQIHDELTSRGLVSLPTPKRPSKPLAVSSVHRMLTNPYYKGDVIYRGVAYKGAHQPLVPAEVWYQVQSVLTAHKSASEATQVHDHYLKGTVYCGACGSRLIVSNAKNRHGNVYPYFVCSGRHSKRTDCTRQAILIEDVEHLIENYYQRVQLTPARREALAGMLHHEFDRLMSAEADELAQLTANRDRLEHEQDRLMQAHYADAIPLAVLKREQDRIAGELDQVNRRLDAHHGEYTDARAHLDDALNLLENCADIYARCDDANRRLCNQAFFTKVYIEEDDELRVENNRPFEMLLDPEVNADALTWAENADKARTPALDSSGQGSSLVRWVHPRTFEPSMVIVLIITSVLGAIIGIQILTTLGVTPNTAIIGVLVAIALSRIPIAALRKFRSVHRQNLVQSNISTATFVAANSLLLPIAIPWVMGRPDLVWPLLIGAAAAALIDFLMLYWMFDSRVFPGKEAWPPGLAAAEAIKAGDRGGRRAGLLGIGTLVGIIGSAIGVPMSAFGVAFIGNIVALTMFGVGLLLRGYSVPLAGVDINALYIPHGFMIGAGVVALFQAVWTIVGRRKATAHAIATGAETSELTTVIDEGEAAPPVVVERGELTRSEVAVRKALTRGAVLYVVAAALLAAVSGLVAEMSVPMLIGWVLFAMVACIAAEFIVGLSAMHSGWFPAFATALIFLSLALIIGFPPVAVALVTGFIAAGGPAFADAGYDFKTGWILRRNESRAMELEGRKQQFLAGVVGMAVALVVVALAFPMFFANDQIPPVARVFVKTIQAGVDPALITTLLLWAIPGAIIQAIGGPKRQMGILLATGMLILNPAAGWAVLVGIVLRIVYSRLRKDKEAAESEMTIAAAGFIAGDALWSFGNSMYKLFK